MKHILLCLSLPVLLFSGSLHDHMTLYIDGESMKATAPVTSLSSSIRQKPGKFGKGLLIERRTINYANPEDLVLGANATITGKSNRLSLPADGFAAIPQTGLRPGSCNVLSFVYCGTGTLDFSLNENGEDIQLATLQAKKEPQNAAVRFFPKSDAASLKIRSDKPVTLDCVMVDRNIHFANTYHAPGKLRNVDVIRAESKGVFDPCQGAVSFWLKSPWCRTGGEASGMAIMNVLMPPELQKKHGGQIAKVISVWGDRNTKGMLDSYMVDINKGIKSNVAASFRTSEIPESPDGWFHFAICWSVKDGVMTDTITINGEKTFTRSGKFTPFPAYGTIEIGYSCGSYTNGIIDDFAMFNRPLTPTEIRRIATDGKPLSQLK